MKKLTFLQKTLMPLSLAFVLLITFIVGAFPKKEAIPVSADESNTVHYFSNSAPTYSYSTIARRYQHSEIDYVDTLDGLDRFNVWIETIDSVGDNDVIYIDFPWLSTMQTVQILEKVNGKCNQIYFISARELDEYPIEEDEDGNVYSMEEFFAQYSGAVEFYKTQKNEFYNFIVNSANEIVDLFENDISNSTFLFDASIIGSLKDSWREIRNTNAFANYAPAFYVFVKRIAQKAGIYAEDLEGFLREFAMREISIYVHCEENSFVKLSRFFEEDYFLLDEIYEGFAVTMDIPDSKTEKCVAIANAPVDDIYRDFLVYSQLLYFGESDVDSRIVRPLVYLYVDIDIDQPELKYINQDMLRGDIDEQPEDTLFEPVSAMDASDFVEENITRFVAEYNAASGGKWKATKVEDKFAITVKKKGKKEETGVFMDFDNDNGYAVKGEDYKLYDLQTSGESPYKGKTFDACSYSVKGEYFYTQGELTLSVNNENNGEESFIYEETQDSKHYEGQDKGKTGNGCIVNLDAYVHDKYGKSWKLSDSRSLEMKGYDQLKLSCYIEQEFVDGKVVGVGSEENCWVVSAYTILQYMADSKWDNVPKSSELPIIYDPFEEEPEIYSLFFEDKEGTKNNSDFLGYDSSGNAVYRYRKKADISFPELYTDVRRFVSGRYEKINKGSIFSSVEIIEKVAESYGHDVVSYIHFLWGAYAEAATKEINDGKPLLWSTTNDTYGPHTMAVAGYAHYHKVINFWLFTVIFEKLFYEIRDGWSAERRYYDMSGHLGLAAIISFDYK